MSMRILLLGKNGQLGWELRRSLAPLGQLIALDYPEIDLAQVETVRRLVRETRPDVLINATAYTAVDRAESEVELAMAVNALAPGILAEEAAAQGIAFVHYSTDYVFDGAKGSAYIESDIPNPLGVYGRSKLEGEQAVTQAGDAYLILRTSWVYSLRRDSFVTKVLQWSRQQPVLRVVADQVGNPTWSRMLAEATAILLAKAGPDAAPWLRERRGIYHLAGSGAASRLEWAQAILQGDPKPEEQIIRQIEPALTAEFPTPARRPLYSALNCDRFRATFNISLPDWREALRLAMEAE
jgi:dTDP-4-dehydrorhamnose reductase